MTSEVNIQSIKEHLLFGAMESSEYCLISSSKWCAEQAHSLSVPLIDTPTPPRLDLSPNNLPRFLYARNLFAMKEYLRAFELLESCEEAPALFLRFYCKLVAIINHNLYPVRFFSRFYSLQAARAFSHCI